jgi:hypothetical protein
MEATKVGPDLYEITDDGKLVKYVDGQGKPTRRRPAIKPQAKRGSEIDRKINRELCR